MKELEHIKCRRSGEQQAVQSGLRFRSTSLLRSTDTKGAFAEAVVDGCRRRCDWGTRQLLGDMGPW